MKVPKCRRQVAGHLSARSRQTGIGPRASRLGVIVIYCLERHPQRVLEGSAARILQRRSLFKHTEWQVVGRAIAGEGGEG